MVRKLGLGLAIAFAAGALATPAATQSYSTGYTFVKAVKERDGQKVTDLLAGPGSAVVNVKDRDSGDAGLHIVTRDRDLTWLRFLLGKGARVDLQNNDGNTPLALAAQLGWIEGAQMLLGQRAAVDAPNARGETPLIHAVHKRDVAMVRLLLSLGANPKRTDSVAGYSALDYAKQDRRAASILRLLEAPSGAKRKEVAGPGL